MRYRGFMAAKGATAKSPEDILEKVEKLVALASSAPEEEARTAAVTAAMLMHEHKLVCVPREVLERAKTVIGDAEKLVARAKSENRQQLLIGGLVGLFLAKKGF